VDEIWSVSDGPWCIHGAHSHKKNWGNRPRGSASGCQNVFCFLLSSQRGLSATYPAPISTIFETIDVNHFPHAYAVEKNPISAQGVFQVPKTAQNTALYRVGVGDRAAAQTAQWRWESFRELVDILRMCLLYMSFGGGRTIWAL